MAFKERITIHKLPVLEYALKNLLTNDEYSFIDNAFNNTIIPDDFISATSLSLFAMLLRVGMIDEYNIQEYTSLGKIIPPSIDVFSKLDVINSKNFNEYAEKLNKCPLTEQEKQEYIKRYYNENQLLTIDEIKIIHGWHYDEDNKPTNEERYLLFKAVYFTLSQNGFIHDALNLLNRMKEYTASRLWRNNISKCIKICINKFVSAYSNNDKTIKEIKILNERMCLY